MSKKRITVISVIAVIIIIIAGLFGMYYVKSSNHAVSHKSTTQKIHHVNLVDKYINYDSELSHINKQYEHNIIPARSAKSAVVMDEKTGSILYQKDPNQLRHIASISKLMTLYLVEQKATKENAWNQRVNIPWNLHAMSYDTKDGLGGFKFKTDHTYDVMDLFKASMIESSNNSAIALGEWVANGNNKTFIKMMNKQAKAWNLKCHFVSSSGLENDSLSKFKLMSFGNKRSANQVSAMDVALIARHFLADYPRVVNISRQSQSNVDHQPLNNVNELLPDGLFYDPRVHVDGLKTGFTPSSGLCYVGTAHMPNRDRIITVVLNDQQEFKDSIRLIDSTYGLTPRGNASIPSAKHLHHVYGKKVNR